MYKPLYCTCDNIKTVLITDFQMLTSENNSVPEQIYINKVIYDTSYVLIERELLFKKARKLTRSIEDVIQENGLDNFDIVNGRSHLVEILTAIRCNIIANNLLEDNAIDDLLIHIEHFMTLYNFKQSDNKIISKIVSGSIANNDSVLSQCFHHYLDVQWLVLTICYLCRKHKNILNVTQKVIINNLIYLAHYMYDMKSMKDTPFLCNCLGTFWSSFEHLTWKSSNSETEFWSLYNNAINNYDNPSFCMWLMQKIVVENGIKRTNYTLVNITLKSLLSDDCHEHKLLQLLQTLKPILNNVWLENAKIDPYLCLWDYFFKNINSLNVEYPSKLVDFIQFMDVMDERKEFNSYQLFVNMLLHHFKTHPLHWSKLKGRIYSRLPIHKMEYFNEKGIFNISLIFFALLEVNFDESSKKLFELLSSTQKNNFELLAMIYLALIAKHVLKGKPVNNISEATCQLLQQLSTNRNNYHVIRNVLEGFECVMNLSQNYNLKQYKFFGNWMIKYVPTCPYVDLVYLVNLLTWIIENVHNTDDYYDWMSAYNKYILPSLKQIINTNAPPQLGKLFALMLKNGTENAQLLTNLNNNTTSLRVISQFLTNLLQDSSEIWTVPTSRENVVVQMWINCTICGIELSENVVEKIFKFDLFSALRITGKCDWLSLLIALENGQNIPFFKLKQLCESIFGHLDGYIKHLLNVQTNDLDVNQIFSHVGQLFEHCITLIYDKSRGSCLLSRLLSVMLLPTDVLRGISPKSIVLNAIEVNYHKFIIGLFKLDYVNDPFVERNLKDIIIKYLAHFPTSNSPILLCFEYETIARFALDKINRNFLIHSAKSPEDVTYKALKLLHRAIEQCINVDIMKLIIKTTLPGIFEILMYNQSKQIAIDVIKRLIESEWYIDVQEEFCNSVKYVMEKNLAFNSNNFFQLINLLIKLIPTEIKLLLPDLKKQICTVEKMRGVGYDNTLRNALYKIENSF